MGHYYPRKPAPLPAWTWVTSLFTQPLQLEISPSLVFLPLCMSLRKLACMCRTLSNRPEYSSCSIFSLPMKYILSSLLRNNVFFCLAFAHPPDPAPSSLSSSATGYCGSLVWGRESTYLPCLPRTPHTWNVTFSGFWWVPEFCVHQSHFPYSL